MANDHDTTARNVAADAVGALCLRLALHTGDPGGANSATNEVTGGSPAYARKACSWNAASSGSAGLASNVVFDVPGSTTVAYISGWNTAGTVRYFKKAVTSQAFAVQGTYTVLTTADINFNDA